MVKYTIAFLLIISAILLYGCKSTDTGKPVNKEDNAHNSQNSLDWAGLYSGVIPCADCEGIKTKVRLNNDGTFHKESVYLGKNEAPFERKGNINWNENGNIVMLAGLNTDEIPEKYFVAENRLIKLDMDGKFIEGELAENYVLKKIENLKLADVHWSLIELNGERLSSSPGEIFINFSNEENRFAGNAGCNNFSGKYIEKIGFRLAFSQVASTKMACPDMKTEESFFNMLESVDNYTIIDDELHLHRSKMAPLAKFTAIIK